MAAKSGKCHTVLCKLACTLYSHSLTRENESPKDFAIPHSNSIHAMLTFHMQPWQLKITCKRLISFRFLAPSSFGIICALLLHEHMQLEWAENAKSYRIKNYYPARPLHGCPESAHNSFGQIGPNTFCQAASKVYVVSYSSKTWYLEAVFQISGFQWTKIILCLICYVHGTPKLPNKVWGHAASHEASNSPFDIRPTVHKQRKIGSLFKAYEASNQKLPPCTTSIWVY